MANEKYDWLSRVKAVEREHTAMLFASVYLLQSLGKAAVDLEEDLKRLDVIRASDRLEGTYIIRLFSEFEVSLKTFLRAKKVRNVPESAKALINRVASHVKFSGPILENAHEVRLHRNKLVHNLVNGISDEGQMEIRVATSHICTYLSRLPTDW